MDGLTNESPDATPASPEQQQQFDILLGRCRQVMGEAAQEWLATLQQDPVGGAVRLGTQTVRELVGMSEQAGQKVDPAVLLNVGIQLVKDIAAVVNEAGLVPDEHLPEYLQDVLQQSIGEYLRMDAESGVLSQEETARAQHLLSGQGAPAADPQQGMLARMQQGGPQ